jgi:hypothetical protein
LKSTGVTFISFLSDISFAQKAGVLVRQTHYKKQYDLSSAALTRAIFSPPKPR